MSKYETQWPYRYRSFFAARAGLIAEHGEAFLEATDEVQYMSTIDLTDGYCYHPVQCRQAVTRLSTPEGTPNNYIVTTPTKKPMTPLLQNQWGPHGRRWEPARPMWFCPICDFWYIDGAEFTPRDSGLGPRHRVRKLKAMAILFGEDKS